jgi:hypothetical protein
VQELEAGKSAGYILAVPTLAGEVLLAQQECRRLP